MVGAVQNAICWLLMEEGQMTVEDMVLGSQIPDNSIGNALLRLLAGGFVQREKRNVIGGKRLYHYGLTRKGIEDAQHIKRAEVKDYLLEENK